MVFGFGENDKLGKLDLSKLKEGITMAELGIQENSFEASIFSKFDTDYEKGKLSKEEISFKVRKKVCTIKGSDLYIKYYDNSTAVVCGSIISVVTI